MLTRWLDQLPGLSGAHASPSNDEYIQYACPVVSPIPHHNRWGRAATRYAAMNLYRDGSIRISDPPSDAEDSGDCVIQYGADSRDCVIQYGADPTSEVYDGGCARRSTYTPNSHDERPIRQINIHIDRL